MVTLGLLAATLARAGDPPRHPLENARAGQWVLHRTIVRTPDATETTSFRYQWVDKIENRIVHLKTQATTPDGRFGLGAAVQTLVDLDKPATVYKDSISTPCDEEVSVKGRLIRCTRKETFTVEGVKGKLTSTRWISDEVPLYGTARAVTADKERTELSRTEIEDFGDAGGSERPLAPPEAPEKPEKRNSNDRD
jgi:hypothetical protein